MPQFNPDPRLRTTLLTTEEIVDLGWMMLRQMRKQKGCFVSDKEHFFAGAAYLFDAMMNVMHPSSEPTEEDLAVMNRLHEELQRFNSNFTRKLQP